MKKVMSLLIFSFYFSTHLVAQDTSKINFFAGMVGSGFVSIDTGEIATWASLRVGVRMKERITKKLSFDGWLIYDPVEKLVLFRASLKTTWKNGGVSFGYQPTPVSEIRPYPLSVDAQFEFTAESIPPGGTLGTSVWYKGFKLGFYIRKGKPEYHATFTDNKGLSMGIWTSNNKFGGVTAKIELPSMYAMVVATGDNKQALALAIQPIRSLKYKPVWDFAIKNNRITNNLVGIVHPMETKRFTDARYGIAYNFQNRTVGAFFLIGINHKE